jgi:hypothetical protein
MEGGCLEKTRFGREAGAFAPWPSATLVAGLVRGMAEGKVDLHVHVSIGPVLGAALPRLRRGGAAG